MAAVAIRPPAIPSAAASSAGAVGLAALHPLAIRGARQLLDKADAQGDVRVRPRMAAGILEELEQPRMPARILAALAAASERRVVRKQRAKIVWEAVTYTPSMLTAWNEACDTGPFHDGGRIVVLLFGREKGARARAASVFGFCRLERRGVMTLAELTLDYDLVILAHTLWQFLSTHGGAHVVETRALRLLARGGKRPSPAFAVDELPAVEQPPRLVASAEQALLARLRMGVSLLEAGSTKKFFRAFVHPHELGGLRLDEAVRTFSKQGKVKPLLETLKLASVRAVRDDGEGEASIPLPWRPTREARERLRFQLYKGLWYLRL